MARLPYLSALLGGIQGGASGAGQGLQMDAARRRQATLDQWSTEDHTAQTALRNAETQKLKDAAVQQSARSQAIATHWAKAVAGDPNSQAALIAAAPDLAARFQAPDKPETPHRTYDAKRGGIVDQEKGTFTPIPGVTPTPETPTVHGRIAELTKGGMPLSQAFRQARQEFGEAEPAGTIAGESPEIAATRRDIQQLTSNEIRKEHDTGIARSDLKTFDAAHPSPRFQLPLSQQKTANDSAGATMRANLAKALADREAEGKKAGFSVDSATSVLGRLRAGLPKTDEPLATPRSTTAPAVSPAPASHAPDVARIQQENDGYNEAVKQINAMNAPDKAQRLAEAQRIYLARITKLNAGQEPDG